MLLDYEAQQQQQWKLVLLLLLLMLQFQGKLQRRNVPPTWDWKLHWARFAVAAAAAAADTAAIPDYAALVN